MLRQNAREEDLFPFDLLRFLGNSRWDSEFLEDFRAETGTTIKSMFKPSQVNHESDELATWRQQAMLKLDVKLCIPDPSPKKCDSQWYVDPTPGEFGSFTPPQNQQFALKISLFQKEMSASPFATMASSGEKC